MQTAIFQEGIPSKYTKQNKMTKDLLFSPR